MKSLVLKDLFNIGHNAKSMLFILVVFAVALIPIYICMCNFVQHDDRNNLFF